MADNKMKERLYEYSCKVKVHTPEADRTVLQFIADLMCHVAATEEEYELMRSTFRAGYCWHFAHILKATFMRGEVCWAAPFGHFVWVDDNGIPYDAEGLNEGEQIYNIPESYLGNYIKDFIHIPGNIIPKVTDEKIVEIIRQYEKDNNLPEQKVPIYHLPDTHKAFKVSWHADGYTGSFNYLVIADSMEEAERLWEAYVETHVRITRSWKKAKAAMKRHYGGYVAWKELEKNKRPEGYDAKGCYELPYNAWNAGSDHLRD